MQFKSNPIHFAGENLMITTEQKEQKLDGEVYFPTQEV